MKLIYFYSTWDENSSSKKCDFINMISTIDDIEYEICNIDNNKEKWLQYGLKTVPGIVLLKNNAVVCFFAGAINWDIVKKSVFDNKNSLLDNKIYEIENYNVLWSSSCHRYDRWNEQLLNVDGMDTGWSSVSNKKSGEATLVVDLYKKHIIKYIGFVPRKWEFNIDLKDSFPDNIVIQTSEDGDVWDEKKEYLITDKNEANEKRIDLKSILCRYIKITFRVSNLRLEKKYFVQLTNINFYAEYNEKNNNSLDEPSFGTIDDNKDYLDDIVNKRGISYGKNVTTSFWFLNQNQEMSNKCFYESQIVIIPTRGELTLVWPNNKRNISVGNWVKIPKKCVCKIVNETNDKSSFIEIIENVPSFCAWGLRK